MLKKKIQSIADFGLVRMAVAVSRACGAGCGSDVAGIIKTFDRTSTSWHCPSKHF